MCVLKMQNYRTSSVTLTDISTNTITVQELFNVNPNQGPSS